MLELSCESFTNYPGESVFPPLTSQANFWGTGQGRAPSNQQTNCPKINSLMSTFTKMAKHGVPTFFPPKIPAKAPVRSATRLNEASVLLQRSRGSNMLDH